MFAFNYRKMSKRDGTKWISFPFRLRLKFEQKTNRATIIEKEFMEKKKSRIQIRRIDGRRIWVLKSS